MKMMSITQIRSSVYLKWKLCNDIDVGSIERKQLDLCKRNIIFCQADCFCLQGKKEDEGEVFCVPNTLATASAKMKFIPYRYFIAVTECTKMLFIISSQPSSNFHCKPMICSSKSTDVIYYLPEKNCQVIFQVHVKHTEVKPLNNWITANFLMVGTFRG